MARTLLARSIKNREGERKSTIIHDAVISRLVIIRNLQSGKLRKLVHPTTFSHSILVFEVGKASFIKKGYFMIRFAEKPYERTDKRGGFPCIRSNRCVIDFYSACQSENGYRGSCKSIHSENYIIQFFLVISFRRKKKICTEPLYRSS